MNHTTKQTKVKLGWMVNRDMAEVLAIEAASFDLPWGARHFHDCRKQRNCTGVVASHGGQVVGFMLYELFWKHLDILNFATHPDYRRRGVGTQMVDRLIGKLTPQRRTRIVLEVRETNLPAQLFFRACGFRATAVLRDHYADMAEDAYRLEYRCQPARLLEPGNRISGFFETA